VARARICGGELREGNCELRELHRLLALTFARKDSNLQDSNLKLPATGASLGFLGSAGRRPWRAIAALETPCADIEDHL
jgi:hypothetical protein